MEMKRARYEIKEWSISQASLEEVFLAIAVEDEADAPVQLISINS